MLEMRELHISIALTLVVPSHISSQDWSELSCNVRPRPIRMFQFYPVILIATYLPYTSPHQSRLISLVVPIAFYKS
jgi:hypothetical protein